MTTLFLRDISADGVRSDAARVKSTHQQRVEALMTGAGQSVPQSPTSPAAADRLLRARLLFEETLETINALGVQIKVHYQPGQCVEEVVLNTPSPDNAEAHTVTKHTFEAKVVHGRRDSILREIADGCLDIRVIATGTLSACGIADEFLQEEVDNNNLLKFAEGHTTDEFGKLIKPPNHEPPRIHDIVDLQSPF